MTVITAPEHRLDWWTPTYPAIDLVGRDRANGVATGLRYWYSLRARSADFSAPVLVEDAVASLVADGTLTRKRRDDNRKPVFMVTVHGIDEEAIAEGERQLDLRVGEQGYLKWTPPGGGIPTVFVVQTTDPHYETDGAAMRRLEHTWTLNFNCLPFGRSVDPTVIDATVVAAGTTLDACDSATGWSGQYQGLSGFVNVTPTVDTTIKVEGTGSLTALAAEPAVIASAGSSGLDFAGTYSERLSRTVAAFTDRFLRVSIRVGADDGAVSDPLFSMGNGTGTWYIVNTTALGNGWYSLVCDRNSTDPETIVMVGARYKVTYHRDSGDPHDDIPTGQLWIDDLRRAGADSTTFEAMRQLAIPGSRRTPGTLHISNESGLGRVQAWFGRDFGDGYRPDMHRWRVDGSDTHTATPANVSGWRSTGGPITYKPPASIFAEGTYRVAARLTRALAAVSSPELTAQMLDNDGDPFGDIATTGVKKIAGTGAYNTYELGQIELPVIPISPGSDRRLLLTLSGLDAATTDQLWLYRVDEDTTMIDVDCGTWEHLFIDTPSPETPRGSYRVASDDARTDGIYPGSSAVHVAGFPYFTPAKMRFHLVADGHQNTQATVSCYAQWGTFAGSVDSVEDTP